MSRKIKTESELVQPSDIITLIDKAVMIKGFLDKEASDYKARTASQAKLLEDIEAQLKKYAAENKISRIESSTGIVEISSSFRKSLDTKALWGYVQLKKRIQWFWDVASVSLKDATKEFGENVLLEKKIISQGETPFNRVSILVKNQ